MQKVERGLPASARSSSCGKSAGRQEGDKERGKSWRVLPGESKEGLHCTLMERVDEVLEVGELF